MNNLHRELAPISDAAWADLEEEGRRTFKRHLAGRRLVDFAGPHGEAFSAVGTGHVQTVDAPAEGVVASTRHVQPLVELRVTFTLDRQQVDDVERGAKDADWQPVKEAARRLAFAEDKTIFEGFAAAGITGIRASLSNPPITLPSNARQYPTAIGQAVSALRLSGVAGPYTLALGADAYTVIGETTDDGYPVQEHIARLVDGDLIWAPAIDGAFVLSRRGGDFELHIGQDVAIGYLAHDTANIQLYFQESLTFLVYTSEAACALPAPSRR